MNDQVQDAQPSTGLYIGAWILTSIVASIAIFVIDSILVNTTLSGPDFTNSSYWFLAPVLEYMAWTGVVIGMYSLFKTLEVSKVIPWFLGLGGLGVLISIIRTYAAFSAVGLSVPVIFPIAMIVSFLGAVYIVNWYFKTKQPHRY